MSARDWRTLPLGGDRRALVEASAGTGKTWTIAALYLRLLLEGEAPLGPRQVVVATFTEAAAQELRQRIRARLQWALVQVEQPPQVPDANDEAARWLHALRSDANAGVLAARLRLALMDLDQAPIDTLHGLCLRILREAPFESGAPFGGIALVDGAALDAELADDAWRHLVQEDAGDAGREAWIAGRRTGLAQALRQALRPGVEVACARRLPFDAPQPEAGTVRALLARPGAFKPRRIKLRRGLEAMADVMELRALPDAHPTLRTDLSEQFDNHLNTGALDRDELAALRRIVDTFLGRLSENAQAPRQAVLGELVHALRQRRTQRMDQRGVRSFDGLIEHVHDAVRGDPRLPATLAQRWPVALIDESQDTDPLQYRILDAIYRDPEGEPRGQLVLIGDPKQAIYGFRGGDVQTYLQASRGVPAQDRLQLDTNRRSSRAYVEACNEFFALAGSGLAQGDAPPIHYQPMLASSRHDDKAYSVDGVPQQRPLVFHHWHDAPVAADARRDAALDACADHVVELLAGAHRIGDRGLQPGDIAVLLPKNGDIADLQARLRARGVPSVGGGRQDVFASPWAQALQLQLQAAAHPRDSGVVRAALASRLGGLDYAALLALQAPASDAAWQGQLDRYARLHALWHRRGVLSVVMASIAERAQALAGLPDGERALTDLRHLGELLQAQEQAQPGMAQLLAWLARQCEGADAGDEDAARERSLRLESDARRVQLMTLHMAKGLEFPVVLLPLMWAHCGRDGEKTAVVADGERRLLRLDDAALARSREDQQAERFRTLYVALTRAEHACHVYALDPKRARDGRTRTPPADPQRSALDALLERAREKRPGGTLADHSRHIDWREGWPAGPGQHRQPPIQAASRSARPLPPAPLVHARRHSFSTLVKHGGLVAIEGGAASDEGAGVDPAATAEPAPAHPRIEALAPWRGTAFGNALHDLLEGRDHGRPLVEQAAAMRDALHARGVRLPVGRAGEDAVRRMLERLDGVLDATLLPGLRLRDVEEHEQRAEMAFDYVLDAVDIAALRAACDQHGEARLMHDVGATSLHGLMNGKIDLVFRHQGRFHVLDWKSNWLGADLGSYAGAALDRAMDAHHYRLQALLYTVAVHRMLASRLGAAYALETHLGECLYVFLRAAGLDDGAGVWAHRFDPALVRAVDAVLAGAHREAA